MAGPLMSRTWLSAALLALLACDQPLPPRAEGMPLAPGEEREAAPAWRVREGLVASTVVVSGEPLTQNISPGASRLPSRIQNISFSGEPSRGYLWIDHGGSGSWLRVEQDEAHEWALTLTSSNATFDAARPSSAPDLEVSDANGALWFASAGELFYLDVASPGARPERLAAAPGGGIIVSLAWNADESSLFLGVQDGANRASVVALSADEPGQLAAITVPSHDRHTTDPKTEPNRGIRRGCRSGSKATTKWRRCAPSTSAFATATPWP
jgi:hypothetical protein